MRASRPTAARAAADPALAATSQIAPSDLRLESGISGLSSPDADRHAGADSPSPGTGDALLPGGDGRKQERREQNGDEAARADHS